MCDVAPLLEMSVAEQHKKNEFYFLLQESSAEVLTLLQYEYFERKTKSTSRVSLSQMLTFDGRESSGEDQPGCLPSRTRNEANVSCVRETVASGRRFVNQTATEAAIPVGSCAIILHDVLNMRSVCQHLGPRMMTPEQNLTRTSFSVDLIDIADKDNKQHNQGDKTRFFSYDPHTKRQYSE
jgi:hypothetical protein